MKAVRAVLCSTMAIALVSGCAGPQRRLAEEDRKALVDAEQIHVVHQTPLGGFTVKSTGHTLAGVFLPSVVAVAARVSDSLGLYRDLRLEDPVLGVKQRMAGVLASDLRLGNVRFVEEPATSDQIDELRAKFRSGLVLDVRTIGWGLDNERAKYAGRARLLRLADSTLLWQGNCEHVVGKDQDSPTRDALVADDGALLKANLLRAAERCADALASSLAGKD